jgi:putative sigma-54 modulation protein
MSVEVRFKKIDSSESLVNYLYEKMEKLLPHCRGELNVHVDISLQGKTKVVDISLTTQLNSYHSKASSNDYYISADMAVNKILRQVKKHRQKLRMHKNYAAQTDQEAA